METKMMETKCNNCGATEITQASQGAKCMICLVGVMEELTYRAPSQVRDL
ncbi:unnamed protein product [marine sediment metagenome]|uniref:Uncharacterized protein n=1 Tax=marine sediment metagenome TaxID=412755 RepID=X0Y789_9ZZZZ